MLFLESRNFSSVNRNLSRVAAMPILSFYTKTEKLNKGGLSNANTSADPPFCGLSAMENITDWGGSNYGLGGGVEKFLLGR